jgi:hypothetical protein
MSTKESPLTAKQKTNQIIFDCLLKSIEIVLMSHGNNCIPSGFIAAPDNPVDNVEFVRVTTKQLKRNIHTGYVLDLLMDIEVNGKLRKVLVERWKIRYEDKNNNEKNSNLNKHVGILMRTLYCFVRLLPSYQISITRKCNFSFKLYDPQTHVDRCDEFPVKDTVSYVFPPVPTTFGYFTMRVRYVDSAALRVSCQIIISCILSLKFELTESNVL